MDAVKARYEGLFDELTALFFAIDPAGLNYETNGDEYEAEVGTVLPRLEEVASVDDVRRILREEMDRWLSGHYEPDKVDRLASEVWPLWVAWSATARR